MSIEHGSPRGERETKTASQAAANELREVFFDKNGVDQKVSDALLAKAETGPTFDNIHLTQMMNGHRGAALRRVARVGESEEAQHLAALLEWVSMEREDAKDLLPGFVHAKPSKLISEAKSPEDLYERLVLKEKNPDLNHENFEVVTAQGVADVLGMQADAKWTDMVPELFSKTEPKIALQRFMREIGFLPEALFTKKAFRNVGAEDVKKFLAALRGLEKTDFEDLARHERAKLLNYLFIGGHANKLRKIARGKKNITLDTNGILIQLQGFRSHLPYGLIRDETITVLQRDNWAGEVELLEISIRQKKQNAEVGKVEEGKAEQLKKFAQLFGYEGSHDEITKQFSDQLMTNPDQFARVLLKKDVIIPDAIIEAVLDRGEDGIFSVMRFAESYGAEIAGERLTRKAGLFTGSAIGKEANESYVARAEILHDPRYYNSLKAVKLLLEKGIESDLDNHFAIFRGSYKTIRRQDRMKPERHAFVEVLHDGDLSRVLLEEEKHLDGASRRHFEKLPEFDRKTYESLEYALRSFDYFSTTIRNLKKIASEKKKNWQKRFASLAETEALFLLRNVTKYYRDADALADQIIHDDSEDSIPAYLSILDEAKETYEDFLYERITSREAFEQHFAPEVIGEDVGYGERFADEAEEHCVSYGFDRDLCLSAPPVRVVRLTYKINDPTETIPKHVEESCLDALRIDRARPLINVIGGCKHIEAGADGEDPLEAFANSVMRVAHDHKANVGIPGTQSGIGVTFGRYNTHYRNQFGHLSRKEQAHMFAISPGGSTYYPGNPSVYLSDLEHTYAMTPVDSILPPFAAEWSLRGKDRLTAAYLKHIAYMEALYAGMSEGQPKVMVVGNGGMWSIAEINESLKYDFDLILIKDSGRFAEIAAMLVGHLDEIDFFESDEKFGARIIGLIDTYINNEVKAEFYSKDFGYKAKAENDHVGAYRVFFKIFLERAKRYKDRIKVTSLAELERNLDSYVSVKK